MSSNYPGRAIHGRIHSDRRYGDDPYRAARRGDSGTDFDDILSLSPGSDIAHSRSASDSSTQKLTTTAPLYYEDDPYARYINENKRNSKAEAERTNSYLPYSHHRRDPHAPVAPIYIEDTASVVDKDRTISIQPEMMLTNTPPSINEHVARQPANIDELEFNKKRPRRRWCGMRRRFFAAIVILFCALVTLIWFFVWPRVPRFTYIDVESPSYPQHNITEEPFFNGSWILNMTADNSDNWIPTHIRDMAVTVIYRDTNQAFGYGNSGKMQLRPRAIHLVEIPISIYYKADVGDPTLNALSSACGSARNTAPVITPPDTFSIDFLVKVSIDGIAWSTTRNVSVPQGFTCPL
ncbi:hypothetical protein BJV82DRAFT_628600 [Fennellomyces sp. T-0311]|nr:hypothetical protein BJV82DRAFT_628600 [Fennellomyces sp. T-0311]